GAEQGDRLAGRDRDLDAAHRPDRPVRPGEGLPQLAQLDAGAACAGHGTAAHLRAARIAAHLREARIAARLRAARIAAHLRAARIAFSRSTFGSTTLRIRTADGVTSTASSSRTNSRASSRVSLRCASRRTSTSEVEERMFVRCFSLTGLTSRSSERAFSPMIIPSYTSSPGPTNKDPR